MRYVIIGNGAAGNAAAQAIRTRDPAAGLVIISDEPEPAYYRPLITGLIEGGAAQDISCRQRGETPPDAELRLGKRIKDLDAGLRRVTFEDGETLAYDRLLLATGAAAILPEIPGLPGAGTFALHTLADARAIARAARGAKCAVVIGAGRVGLKAALALRRAGLDVVLVEQGPHAVPLQYDAAAGRILARALEAQGINFFFGQTLTEVRREKDRIQGVALAGGRVLPGELIVAAVGVRANRELAGKAGLRVNQGIVVDQWLRTSDPNIYAAGDAAESMDLLTGQNLVSGLWTNAVEMGRIAGRNMAGANQAYPGAWAVLNSLDVAGIPTVCIGLTNPPPGEGYRVQAGHRGNNYRKLVFHGEALVGALLVGDIDAAGVYAGLIKAKAQTVKIAAALEQPRRVLAAWLAGCKLKEGAGAA
jgi:NAD(P)H-nitrite reductase large subunit